MCNLHSSSSLSLNSLPEAADDVETDTNGATEQDGTPVDKAVTHPSNQGESKPGRVSTMIKTFEAGIEAGAALVKKAIVKVVRPKSTHSTPKSTHSKLYEKKVSIQLPQGCATKIYRLSINYRPRDYKQNPKPLITVAIKPSGDCCLEDTHLFVRFAGYE